MQNNYTIWSYHLTLTTLWHVPIDEAIAKYIVTWWRHQMEAFSAWLTPCAGNSPAPVNSPHKGPVTRSFDVFFNLRLNKRLSKQPWGWWFQTPSWSLWRHCNETSMRTLCNKASIICNHNHLKLQLWGARTPWWLQIHWYQISDNSPCWYDCDINVLYHEHIYI